MNIFFQENQVPVLSWTLGKAIYQKGDSEYWDAFFDYISEDEFYKNIKETAEKYKLPLYSIVQEFFKKAKELDNTTNQKSSAEKYLQCMIFFELEAPANDTQRKIVEITNFINIQLFHTGYHLIAEIDSDQLSHYQSEDPEINNFFPCNIGNNFSPHYI